MLEARQRMIARRFGGGAGATVGGESRGLCVTVLC
jgi:hypothetical protein